MQKQTIGLILLGLVGIALLGSGIFKFVGAEEMGEAFGNANAPYILGVLELLILAAIAIPRTRMMGIILAASYFGGAIAVAWLLEGEFPLPAVIINTLLYIGAYLYRPTLGDGGRTAPIIN